MEIYWASVDVSQVMLDSLEACLKAGAELQVALTASENVDSAKVPISEAIWHRCEAQLIFIMTNYETMDKPLLILHNKNLSSLAGMIMRLTSIFKDLVELKVRRDEIVVNKVFPNDASMICTYRKGTLDDAIHALRIWQQMTDPTWVLMNRMIGSWDSRVNLTLMHVLNAMRVSDIPFPHFNIAGKEEAGIRIIHKIGLLNPKHFQALGKSVQDLTYRLQHTKPEIFNLLSCEGFYEQYHYGMNLTVIFRIPQDFDNPQSLRDQLINNAEPAPVSERLSIVQELAKALGYAHALGLTHIDVHPENIIRLQNRDKNDSSAFLAALVGARDDSLSPDGEIPLERTVYRHPSTQYTDAVKDPILQHDIYSLGVCLLEIGLWQSFINYDAHTMRTTLSHITGIADDASQDDMEQFLVKSAKQRFIDLARNALCYSMARNTPRLWRCA